MRIQDKVVVITGGASGLGLATAHYLAAEKGARIAIFDLNVEAGEQAVAALGTERAMFVATDVSSEESVQNAVDAVMANFGAIHVCINGAAVPTGFKILGKEGKAAPLARFAQATAINLNGVFNVMSKCAEHMAKNEAEAGEERGVVINVSSGAAYEGQLGQCAYSATKAGVIGLNMPAARELGAIGVRVNAIAPGLFLTTMVAALDEKVLGSLKEQMEAPKRLGDTREFAHCCAFIIENAYINAETIRLDAASRMRAK
ncbi:SDR family NAD(P)-dependent oxidoreductase [Pseudomonas aeruginosa]|uniref:3-hydroxyacyl-CoA dehydrogenase FadB2x n=1 Tax=Stutzerimonas stutzeri (strain A1501) TaxID=379731 RepID=A4VH60_STUS1|nr:MULTISPECIES: SDR family NAD(P)-dependent oxidoreductase [Pseudomonadaceae]SAJ30861.1 3-oxoacyl-ACP reductase [Enterobacter cloacae]ABP78311.1 3-hydroxyacyl-CoA dehydrogenase FadB2x [Stutzerimonas stutzeri A1501]ELQ8316640.1 SDR family NAD(P)-dependent oxidoreductase [Pseudomonas aeruginosa]MBG6795674.1 SDR family NAD(P)-dependent oxidoreductase [Pseudomonas aeruginosa]MBG6799191.1 SDR family NAD(P)-dependent oxidoreductase [Pseudomonas aeruginosa]